MCFERVLVGWERRGFATSEYNWEHHFLLREFRNHVWRRFGMPPSLHNRRLVAARQLRVLFLVKDTSKAEHPTFVSNVDVLADLTRAHIPACTVTRASWSKCSLQEQVQHMYDSDIVIAQPGSDIMTTFLLPPWAQVILIPRRVGSKWEAGSNEIGNWYTDFHSTTVPEEDVIAGDDGAVIVPPSVFNRTLRDAVVNLNVLLEANTA